MAKVLMVMKPLVKTKARKQAVWHPRRDECSIIQ